MRQHTLLRFENVKREVDSLRAAGVIEMIERWTDRPASNGGRPARFTPVQVVVALHLAVSHGRPAHLSEAVDVMMYRLDGESRMLLELGSDTVIPEGLTPAERRAAYDAIYASARRAFHRLRVEIDPSSNPLNRRRHDHPGSKPPRFPSKFEMDLVKLQRLHDFTNAIIHASWLWLPREVRRRWKGSAVIDATVTRAWARGTSKRRPEIVSADSDAGYYVRTGDHRADGTEGMGKVIWGFEAHLLVAGYIGDGAPDHPTLVMAMALDRPGHSVAENAVACLDQFEALRDLIAKVDPGEALSSPFYLAGDRAYAPGSDADKFQIPAAVRGWSSVHDYGENHLGVRGSYGGAILVEGGLFCPSMPDLLVNASWDFVVGKTIDKRTFLARISERERYRFRPKQAPNADGSVVMMCPAAGPSPIAKCPLKAGSFDRAGTDAATVVFIGRKPGHEARTDMGGDRPNDNGSKRHDFVPATREEAAGFRGCRQTSITVPRAVGAKYRQPLAYKSTKWKQIYHPLRATVESMNGRAKNDFNNDIEKGVAASYPRDCCAVGVDRDDDPCGEPRSDRKLRAACG